MQMFKTLLSVAVLLAVNAHAADTNTTAAPPPTNITTPAPTTALPTTAPPKPATTPVPTTAAPTTTAPPKPATTPSPAVLPGTAVPYGAVREDTVGPRNVDDLIIAMTNRTNYAEAVARPICIIEVKKVMVQVVAGINYRFTVEGCSQTYAETLGRCNEAGCKSPALWEVSVFAQPWTNTYRVDRIDFLG